MKRVVLFLLLLVLTGCPFLDKISPPSGKFETILTPPLLELSNRQQNRVKVSVNFNGYQHSVHFRLTVDNPGLGLTWLQDASGTFITVNANNVPVGDYHFTVVTTGEDQTWTDTKTATIRVTLDPVLPDVKTPVRQQLKPGQQTIVNLVIAPPQNGASISLSVENPAPDILDVSLVEKSVTISVHASALPQGLIPVGVVVSAGSEQVRVRIPVEIGDGITREFARFNAIRAQANLNPVIFNETDSMNCWLHGRYSVVNNRLEHTEDLSLPYATPEGKQCAGSSNIAESYQAIPELANVTPMSDILFGVPFHALGMIRENQQTVGIGYFSSFDSKYPSLAILGGGITSRGDGNAAQGTVTFPGNESTTDFFQYHGGEWPNPLTSCPNFDPKTTGLPIVIRSPNAMNTTVSNAQLSVDGQPLELCAFGSTQYSNSTDQPINYPDGPHSAEQIARDLLKGYGAAVLLPKAPFLPNKTYLVSLQLNGQPMSWRFHTASTPRTPRLKEKPFGRSISR